MVGVRVRVRARARARVRVRVRVRLGSGCVRVEHLGLDGAEARDQLRGGG